MLTTLFCILRIYPISAQTSQQPQLILSPGSEVEGATWSPDGSRIVSWTDGEAYIWDSQTGDQLLTIQHGGLSSPLDGPIWSSDQQKILSWQDKKVWIWDANKGFQLRTLEHEKDVNRAIWSPNSDKIVSWSSFFQTNSTPKYEIRLFIWDSSSGTLITTITITGGFLQDAKWSPDETQLITLATGEGGGIQAWNVADGTEITELNHAGTLFFTVGDVIWSKDHNRMLVSGINGEAYIADAKTGVQLLSIQNDSWIWSASWNADESKIMGLLPNNRVVFIWNSSTGEPILMLRHQDYVGNAIWNADGSRILTSSSNGLNRSTIHIWDASNGNDLLSIQAASRSISSAWDTSEQFVLGWLTDSFQVDGIGNWKVWDVTSGTEIISGSQSGGLLGALAPLWSPIGSRLLTWRGGEIRVWEF